MEKIILKFLGEGLLKNFTILLGGSAIAQLIGIAASPILSRLYSPEDFGVVGSVMAVVAVLSVLSSLKYETAVVLEKNEERADAVQALCFWILIVTTILFSAAILSMPWWKNWDYVDNSVAKWVKWGIPIIALTGLYNILRYRLNRLREYTVLTRSLVSRRLSLVVTQVALGYCGAQALGLVLGNLVGCIVAVSVICLSCSKSLKWSRSSAQELKDVAKQHYRFPLYSAPQDLLSSLAQQAPIYLLGYFYGVDVVGWYWFCGRLLAMPAQLFGTAVQEIFYRESSEHNDDVKRVRQLYLKFLAGLSAVIILPALVVFFIGPDLFVFAFGEEWRIAGEYSRWIMLWQAVEFLSPPAVSLFSVYSRQKTLMVIEVIFSLLRVSALIIGGCFASDVNTVMMYSIVGASLNALLVGYWYLFLSKKENI